MGVAKDKNTSYYGLTAMAFKCALTRCRNLFWLEKLLSATLLTGKGRARYAVHAGAPLENTIPPDPPNTLADVELVFKALTGPKH